MKIFNFLFLVFLITSGPASANRGIFSHKSSSCIAKENIWYFLYIKGNYYGEEVWSTHVHRDPPAGLVSTLIVKKGQALRTFGQLENGEVYAVVAPLKRVGILANYRLSELWLNPKHFRCGPDLR